MRIITFITIVLALTACGHDKGSPAATGGTNFSESDLEGDFGFANRTCIDPRQNMSSSSFIGASYAILSFRTTQLTYKNYTESNGCLLTNTYEFSLINNQSSLKLNFLSCGYSNSCSENIKSTCDQQNNANYGGGNAGHSISYQVQYNNGILTVTDGLCSTNYKKTKVNPPTIL